MFVQSGQVKIRMELSTIMMEAGDSVIFPSGFTLNVGEVSADFEICGVFMSVPYLGYSNPSLNFSTKAYFHFMQHPVLKFTKEAFQRCMVNLERLTERYHDTSHSFAGDVIKLSAQEFLLDLYDIQKRLGVTNDVRENRYTNVVQGFLSMLRAGEYSKHRLVEHYADRLAVTPKYLLESCRQMSGHTASYWIDLYTTMELAELLRDTDTSLIEIANAFDFPSVSYVSKYIKRNLHLSPCEYRLKVKGRRRDVFGK